MKKRMFFLVVWNDGISTARRVYGVVIDAEGKKATETVMFDPELGPFESHDSPKAAYSPTTDQYAIVWNVRNEFEVVVDGVIVDAELGGSKAIEFDTDKNVFDEFDLIYNPDAKKLFTCRPVRVTWVPNTELCCDSSNWKHFNIQHGVDINQAWRS